MARVWSASLAIVLLLGGCAQKSDEGGASGSQIVAAIYPLAFVADRIAADGTSVADLTPAGAEPHDVELTPQQVVALAEAELTLLIGGGFQPSVEDALDSAEGVTLDALEVIEADLIAGDPHLWLDPLLLADVGDAVAAELSKAGLGAAEELEENAAALRSDLEELDRSFAETLGSCERSELVTAHDAFGYLARRYALEPIPISGIDPAAEPSAARLAEIAEIASERGVTTIFTETLVSPRVAETVAAEAGVATAVLDPLESKPSAGDYIMAMEDNLEVLASALGCRE